MFGQHRFRAAYQQLNSIAGPILQVEGVWAVGLEEAPDSDPDNPGGPQFTVYTNDPGPALQAQSRGDIPTTVVTPYDAVKVVVVEEPMELLGHTGPDTPMRPGSSIGRARGSGTLGALVASPGNRDHIVTAGHVLGSVRSQVFQPGGSDPNPRKVGTVVSNPYMNFRNPGPDVALARIETGFPVDAMPFDSPAPSPDTPAVGLLVFRSPKTQTWLDIGACLSAVRATLLPNSVLNADQNNIGDRVYASGRSSGAIEGIIKSISQIQLPTGVNTQGFICQRVKGGEVGDSGAVCVLNRGPATTSTDDGQIESRDDDDVKEWLPGVFRELDDFSEVDGSGVEADGLGIAKADGKNIVSRIISRIRKLGDLSVTVTTNSYPSPCRPPPEGGQPPRRPTPCTTLILRPGVEREVPQEPDEDSEPTGDSSCCTFGKKPIVTVAGEDDVKYNFTIDVAGSTIRVSFVVTQTVMSAQFRRFGQCFTGTCDPEKPEKLVGEVVLSRSYLLEVAATAGRVKLPVFGELKAGAGSFKREEKKSLQKNFTIPCFSRDSRQFSEVLPPLREGLGPDGIRERPAPRRRRQ